MDSASTNTTLQFYYAGSGRGHRGPQSHKWGVLGRDMIPDFERFAIRARLYFWHGIFIEFVREAVFLRTRETPFMPNQDHHDEYVISRDTTCG